MAPRVDRILESIASDGVAHSLDRLATHLAALRAVACRLSVTEAVGVAAELLVVNQRLEGLTRHLSLVHPDDRGQADAEALTTAAPTSS
jgi:hypothetical protein